MDMETNPVNHMIVIKPRTQVGEAAKLIKSTTTPPFAVHYPASFGSLNTDFIPVGVMILIRDTMGSAHMASIEMPVWSCVCLLTGLTIT